MRLHPLLGWLCLPLAVSCTGRTPRSDLAPPDVNKISVFYPIDRFVRGRGQSDAAPPEAVAVSVRALPEENFTVVEVDREGGFLFSIRAKGGQTLELASSTDINGAELSDSVFVQIPPFRELPNGIYTCCNGSEGQRCVSESRMVDGNCPADTQIVERMCNDDLDCRVESGEYVLLDPDAFTVSPPNQNGLISISGVTEPNALMKITNRRLNGVDLPSTTQPFAQVTDDMGRFSVEDVFGRGDDELVFQTILLNGIRSAEVARLVPDAVMDGVDVIGIYAASPLRAKDPGEVLLVLSPYGVDGRGMCPNAAPELWKEICYTGGLTHDMVQLEFLNASNNQSMMPVSATVAPNRSREGSREALRGGPLDLVLALDMSDTARNRNATDSIVEAASEFIRTSRQRDRIGVVFYGLTPDQYGRRTYRLLLENAQPEVLPPAIYEAGVEGANLTQLASVIRDRASDLAARASTANPLDGGVLDAAVMLSSLSSKNGRIILFTTALQPGTPSEIFDVGELVLGLTGGDLSTGQPGITVDAIGIDVPDLDTIGVPAATTLNDITQLTTAPQGTIMSTSLSELAVDLQDLRADIYGGIGLLYNVQVPENVSKIERVTLRVSVTVEGVTKTKDYTGRLRIPFN